jgi:hypothetical protein
MPNIFMIYFVKKMRIRGYLAGIKPTPKKITSPVPESTPAPYKT